MRQGTAIDGFRLAYERTGSGRARVLLLHGWPGDRTDYRDVVPLVSADADVIVPDLRGFGESDKHEAGSGQPVQRRRPGPQRHRADRRAGAGTAGHRRL